MKHADSPEKKHFIPTWDWFVDTEVGKRLLAENGQHVGLIATAFKLGVDAAQGETAESK